MYKILMIDDERDILEMLALQFQSEGYLVYLANDANEALKQLSVLPDLILLDINMPEMNGLELCTMIREHVNCPIIFLTARISSRDMINGLMLGGDDYITKPFGMMELVSRVKAVLRRSSRNEKKDEIIVGQLKIYPNKHKVKSCGNEVTLTNKEFKLLCLLVESKGNVLNRDQLLTNIWGYDFDGETRTVDVHIRSLRQKLGECGKLIETVRGIGYRIGGNES